MDLSPKEIAEGILKYGKNDDPFNINIEEHSDTDTLEYCSCSITRKLAKAFLEVLEQLKKDREYLKIIKGVNKDV